ncbi:thiamine S protein [Methanoculleus sp. FWC-SCC3]|uniref:Thiamine S protein n=1 Tax=Methanoculleus methanifontis TaxID=2584086 RepID=A0ABT8LZZ7_9EURY|nr:thiamine S protein [Methanoculleus sp. FWC-SCC3]MDN7012023.1 thiamine S protein [Methanoculleus sp. FWC-SCC3]
MLCRFTLIPDGGALVYRGRPGDTYETALLSFGLNPDTALVFCRGRSVPQDEEITEEEAGIFLASSRG